MRRAETTKAERNGHGVGPQCRNDALRQVTDESAGLSRLISALGAIAACCVVPGDGRRRRPRTLHARAKATPGHIIVVVSRPPALSTKQIRRLVLCFYRVCIIIHKSSRYDVRSTWHRRQYITGMYYAKIISTE